MGYRVLGGGGGGGDSDQTISVGTETSTLRYSTGVLGSQAIGTITESFNFTSKLTESVGTETSTLALANAGGSETRSVGTGTSTLGFSRGVLSAQSVGTETSSLAAGSSILGTEWAGTATVVSSGGTVDWINKDNATGDFNGTEASITASAASASMDDALNLDGYTPASTPSGFTRTKVEILVRHRWDSTGQPLETCAFTLTLRDSAANVLSTLKTINQATPSQDSLITETYDVTTAVAGQNDTQLAGDIVRFNAVCQLLTALQGNFSWSVDGAHMRITYTRSGIT